MSKLQIHRNGPSDLSFLEYYQNSNTKLKQPFVAFELPPQKKANARDRNYLTQQFASKKAKQSRYQLTKQPAPMSHQIDLQLPSKQFENKNNSYFQYNSSSYHNSDLADTIQRLQNAPTKMKVQPNFSLLASVLQKSRNLAKQKISEYCKQLRQHIWLKIQQMFRRITQYGDEFYDSIQQIAKQDAEKRKYSINDYIAKDRSLIHSIVQTIDRRAKDDECLFSCEQMQTINEKIVEKVGKYLNQVLDKYANSLFHFSRQVNQQKDDQLGDSQRIGTKNVNKQNTNLRAQRLNNMNNNQKIFGVDLFKKSRMQGEKYDRPKSVSAQKHDQRYIKISCTNSKDKQVQFQQLFQIISQKQRRANIKLNLNQSQNQANDSNNHACMDQNAYKQNQALRQSLQQLNQSQNQNSHRASQYFARVKGPQSERKPHNKILNFKSLAISPVISRVKFQRDSKYINSCSYVIGVNQQAINLQWCEQIDMIGISRILHVPSSQDSSIMQQRSLGGKDNAFEQSEYKYPSDIQIKTKQKDEKQKIICLTFCNNYEHIAVGSRNSCIYIFTSTQQSNLQGSQLDSVYQLPLKYSRRKEALITKLVGHNSSICCLHYNSSILFSGSDSPCCSVYLWCTKNWTVRTKLSFHSAAVCSIVTIPNTEYMVSCSLDKTIVLYNYASCQITDLKRSKNSKSEGRPYAKLIYYERLQTLAAMVVGQFVEIFEIEFADQNKDKCQQKAQGNQPPISKQLSLLLKINAKQSINCNQQISTIQKAGTSEASLLVVGLIDGAIKIYSLPQNINLKTIHVNKGAIISMLTFSRAYKMSYPLVAVVCSSNRSLCLVNTQTEKIKELNVQGNMNIDVGCGVGPVMVFKDSNEVAWVGQTKDDTSVYFGKFQIL